MDFSLDVLYKMENDVDSVLRSVFGADWENVNRSTVMKSDKGTLANLVMSVVGVLGTTKCTLRSAAVTMEQLKSEQIGNQKTLLKLQNELIQSKDEQVKAVQTTVKSEIQSFSDVVKQGCGDKITTTKLKAVVRSAVQSDDRKRAVMLFGLEEAANEEVRREVDELLGATCLVGKPAISDCYRVGAVKQGTARPVKVLFQSSDAAARVLRSATTLKDSRYSRVYITPDRTREEREERKTLVNAMKEKISSEPQRYHYIRDGVVCSREKETSSTPRSVVQPTETSATSATNSSRPVASSARVPVTSASGWFEKKGLAVRGGKSGLNNTR